MVVQIPEVAIGQGLTTVVNVIRKSNINNKIKRKGKYKQLHWTKISVGLL